MPRVEELNYLSSETSVLKNFGKRVLDDETTRKELGFVAAGLATTITTNSNLIGTFNLLALILNIGSKIGIAKTVVTSGLRLTDFLIKAREETQKANKTMSENSMFYYYKAKDSI